MLNQGIYEQLINKLLSAKLESLDREQFFVKETIIEKKEAAQILTQYLCEVINYALSEYNQANCIEQQIELSNKIIRLIRDELKDLEFDEDIITINGKILKGIFSRMNADFAKFENYLNEITPFTRLTQSELFTGGNVGLSLDSELRKEILSSNKIYLLISFIKWEGFRLLQNELTEFTNNGGELRVITTTYMGATDAKAVDFLSSLENTTVKVSYNTNSERLHAKAYLFYRNTGFHTGYIGSSNFSRSALTKGLEWNLKITTKEISHIIDKFQKTFETYWQDEEFEKYESIKHYEKLKKALKIKNNQGLNDPNFFFEIKPYKFQEEILEKLETERTIHKRYKNLIVAATGTGKTIISAFDFKRYLKKKPSANFLFVAHRKEILVQAHATFAGVLRDNNFGEFWGDGIEPTNYKVVFASLMTLSNNINNLNLASDYYDYIIIDEVHHIAADSYRPILAKFKPEILIGLTATPERMDNANILDDFCNTIAAEIRLPEALDRKLLCPFQYFGITDSIDLSSTSWQNGKYIPSELTRLYTQNDIRVGEIITKCKNYLRDYQDVRALGFCITIEHAVFMAEKFVLAGLKADYIVAGRDELRASIKHRFSKKEINYLFVVDIFNEGVDIPEIDTVLFLRPTESLTIFLQQLGRGLRLSEDKNCLTVLDFVGNSRPEYDFEGKFRALIGKTNSSTKDELEKNFPHLPLGCSIVLEKKAKEFILDNITKATQFNTKQLINKIINYKHQTVLPLTLSNFCNFYQIPIQAIYKRESWSRLCQFAKQIDDFSTLYEKEVKRAISKKWLQCNSYSYLNFILQIAKNKFEIPAKLNSKENLMLMMLYYDLWQKPGKFNTLVESITTIGKNHVLTMEIIEALTFLINKISHIEIDIDLHIQQPLKVHSRYSREQILVAFGVSNFEIKSSNIEGVINIENKNIELLLVTLEKTEKDYSPTTMYNDYAIDQTEFHWQSQNSSRPDVGKGLSYIQHQVNNKIILLFVREKNKDEYGNTISYVFLGEADYLDYYGSKPMSINWKLHEPLPHYIWKAAAKLAVG